MSAEFDPVPVRRRSPIWMRALLIASLAVNVAVIGVVTGYKMKDGEDTRALSRQVSWIVRMVPDHRKEFALTHFAGFREQLIASRMAQMGDLDRILAAVRTDPFEAQELRVALEVRRASSDSRRVIVHEGLVTLLEQFEQEERLTFANNLEARLEKVRLNQNSGGTISTSSAQ